MQQAAEILDRDEAAGRDWPRSLSELEAEGYRVTPETRCAACSQWVSRVIDPAGRARVFTLHPKPFTQEPAFSEHHCQGTTPIEDVWPKANSGRYPYPFPRDIHSKG